MGSERLIIRRMGVSWNTFASYLGAVHAPLNKLRQLGVTKWDPFNLHIEPRLASAHPDRVPAPALQPELRTLGCGRKLRKQIDCLATTQASKL